jgi:hypothetical protein
MKTIHEIQHIDWNAPFDSVVRKEALEALENGAVLYFPKLAFTLSDAEVALRSPHIIDKSKNVSYNPANDKLGGTICTGAEAGVLKNMIARYAAQTKQMLHTLLPDYSKALIQARTSFRPVQVAGRQSSWRKDDTRLHVDSFPASPTQGKRIMRIFNNVNPEHPRVWRVGEPFEDLAKRFFSKLTPQLPGAAIIMRLLHVTRARRSEYDHFMLQLHDRMKEDTHYQETVPQIRQEFPPGSTWVTFSDQVSHAAMTGQYQFEQTYLLPVSAMENQESSPLRVLERLAKRKLA